MCQEKNIYLSQFGFLTGSSQSNERQYIQMWVTEDTMFPDTAREKARLFQISLNLKNSIQKKHLVCLLIVLLWRFDSVNLKSSICILVYSWQWRYEQMLITMTSCSQLYRLTCSRILLLCFSDAVKNVYGQTTADWSFNSQHYPKEVKFHNFHKWKSSNLTGTDVFYSSL